MDNILDASSRDRLTNSGHTGKADRRGRAAAALALRTAILEAVQAGIHAPDALAEVVTRVQAAGDPYANQPALFPDVTGPTEPVQQRLF
ncbi:hypothetical protein [Streptomyces celluloflavus]|uniref:hypothetical protein n=1 Tax=Streptomyces celluloflavus TaxID=58344 RepID=UPI00368BB16A